MLAKPSIAKIYLLHFLTLGFYFFFYCSRSRADIHRSARQDLVPTTWLLALPGGNYYWMWQYANALEQVSYKRIKASNTFLLYIIVTFLWFIVYKFLPSANNVHLNAPVVIGFIVFFTLLEIAGLAFFCATIQKKINLLTANQPVNPIA